MGVLDNTRSCVDQDGGESLHIVFGESRLITIRIENVYHSLASVCEGNGRGSLEFLKFGGSRLAVSAPIRFADHNRLVLTLKAITLLCIVVNEQNNQKQNNNQSINQFHSILFFYFLDPLSKRQHMLLRFQRSTNHLNHDHDS